MRKNIDIRDFKGVFSNADPEDIPPEFCQVLENLRTLNGKLVKTGGMGVKTGIFAIDYVLGNLAAYIHSELTAGFVYMAVDFSFDTMFPVFHLAGSGWIALSDEYPITGGPFYHRKECNPIVQAGGILRILPGNAGEIGGSEAKGFWFGYIDRTCFDGAYAPEAGFYGYPVNVERSTLSWSVVEHDYQDSGFVFGDSYYYFFSQVYDGIQESLLSENQIKWTPSAAHKFPRLTSSTFSAAGINRRITGLKVYRSRYNATMGTKSPYHLIQDIDFLREAGGVLSGANGCVFYTDVAVVPAFSTVTFDGAKTYTVSIDGGSYETIDTAGAAAGEILFHYPAYSPAELKWNVAWSLKEDGSEIHSGTSGGYCAATKLGKIGSATPEDIYSGGVIIANAGSSQVYTGIDRNSGRVVLLKSAIANQVDVAWWVLSPANGTYIPTISGDNVMYTFFDAALADGAEHPLYVDGAEVSIKVNGEFARIIAGRLWQGNVVLDPGGKNEAHEDWVSYSELGQYDVNPVSNVIYCSDREGGPVMGIAEVFGCPVVLKKQAIIFINIRADLNDPSKWSVKESAHNIGNLAKQGYIEVNGSLYVCWVDAIYRLRPNNLADADATPTERLKVTGPIEDVYQALTLAQKEAIKSAFDPSRGEIVFTLGSEIWALNVDSGTWREIVSAGTADLFATDENGQVMACDYEAGMIRTMDPATPESVAARWRKTFRIAAVRKETVREIEITYQSASALTVNIYADGDTEATWTGTLPVSSQVDAVQLYPRFPAKVIEVEIVSAAGTGVLEIGRVKIEHD